MIPINRVETSVNNFSQNNFNFNIETSYKEILLGKLHTNENFEENFKSTLEKYFGQSGQIYYHIMDASGISRENWTHNDFPYEKFLQKNVDESVLNWKPSRSNPAQSDSEVQQKLTAMLGKNAVVIPPELAEKLKTNSALRKKVISNIEKILEFHIQPPKFAMPGVKEYGTKIFGSVTILNTEGDVENCTVTSGGTIMGPDEETLRQIEMEQKRKLRRKIYNRELLEESQKDYFLDKNLMLSELMQVL